MKAKSLRCGVRGKVPLPGMGIRRNVGGFHEKGPGCAGRLDRGWGDSRRAAKGRFGPVWGNTSPGGETRLPGEGGEGEGVPGEGEHRAVRSPERATPGREAAEEEEEEGSGAGPERAHPAAASSPAAPGARA